MKPEQITAWALDEASAEEREQMKVALLENPKDKERAEETKAFCDFLLGELRDDSLALTKEQRERLKAQAVGGKAPQSPDAGGTSALRPLRKGETGWNIGVIVRLAVAACAVLGGFWTWQVYSRRQVEAPLTVAEQPGIKVQLASKAEVKKKEGEEARLLAAAPVKLIVPEAPSAKPLSRPDMPESAAGVNTLVLNKDSSAMTPADVERLKRVQDERAYGLSFGGGQTALLSPVAEPMPQAMALSASSSLLQAGKDVTKAPLVLGTSALVMISEPKEPESRTGLLTLFKYHWINLSGTMIEPWMSDSRLMNRGQSNPDVNSLEFASLPAGAALADYQSSLVFGQLGVNNAWFNNIGEAWLVLAAANASTGGISIPAGSPLTMSTYLNQRLMLYMNRNSPGLISFATADEAVLTGRLDFEDFAADNLPVVGALFGRGQNESDAAFRPVRDEVARASGMVKAGSGALGLNGGTSIERPAVDLMDAPEVTTKSGTLATMVVMREFDYSSFDVPQSRSAASAMTFGNVAATSPVVLNAALGAPVSVKDVRSDVNGVPGYTVLSGGTLTVNGSTDAVITPQKLSGPDATAAAAGSNTLTLPTARVIDEGGMTKTEAGTVTLAGANSYAGTTMVNGGRLAVTGGVAMQAGGADATAAAPQMKLSPASEAVRTSIRPYMRANSFVDTDDSTVNSFRSPAAIADATLNVISGGLVNSTPAVPPLAGKSQSVAAAPIKDTKTDAFYLGDRTKSMMDVSASGVIEEKPSSNESYTRIIENEMKEVAREPLSTLSIDVDTASYANVRRFLNQNMIPPPDAVRIEELVNYFPTAEEGPAHDAKEPFAVRVELAPCPWQPVHRLARIAIKGREMDKDRKASNLVFLVDVSGSMNEPAKLPLVQQSLRMLTEQLGEGDRVTMVVYAGSSGVVLPPTNGDKKAEILAAIDKLSAGGSTHGSAGIKLAYEQAVAGFIKGGVNRVILCTDGDFNVGVSSPEELEKLIKHKAKSGVFLSVLGFGSGNLKDRTMETLADKGNGNYAYIDSLSEARKVLVEQMSGTLVTIAKDVKIQVEFNPAAVRSYRLIGYENRLLAKEDFNDDTKDAGEIGAGHSVVALYEVVPANLPAGVEPRPVVDSLKYQTSAISPAQLAEAAKSGEMMTVKLRYKEPESDLSKLIEVPTKDEGKTLTASTEEFKFSAAVAGFGLLLRDSSYKGTLGWETVRRLALDGKGADKLGYRGEFLQLVDKARGLKETK